MPHLWIVLSLTSAFSLATSVALTKKIITPGTEYVIAWLRIVYSLPALSAAMALTPVPSLDKTFFLAFCGALPLEVLARSSCTTRLCGVSPLSLSLPFLSFTPAFLMLFSRLIMGEAVSAAGAAGIALIALGLYDVSGRLVRTLLDGRVEAGEVRVPIDGFDARGRALSSGVYFYQVKSNRMPGKEERRILSDFCSAAPWYCSGWIVVWKDRRMEPDIYPADMEDDEAPVHEAPGL